VATVAGFAYHRAVASTVVAAHHTGGFRRRGVPEEIET
jgi:hypothetical protein